MPGALVGARDVLYSALAARRTALAVPVIDFRSSHCGGPGCAPIAQLDRASDYESEGRKFESCWAHHSFQRGTARVRP